MLIVAFREITAEVDAAGFFALEGQGDHEPGDGEEVLQFPAFARGEFASQDVAAPEVHVSLGFLKPGSVAYDAHLADHQAAERVSDVGHIQVR